MTRKLLSVVPILAITCGHPSVQTSAPHSVLDLDVVAHIRTGDPRHPYGQCLYSGRTFTLNSLLAKKLLSTFVAGCSRDDVTIVNVKEPGLSGNLATFKQIFETRTAR
jgi:hypothetical protein